MRLEYPEPNKAQQGAIFNCVNVVGYEGCQCYGLILTARCDLEHNKQSVINYLPVVRFRDWAARSLVNILSRRSCSELAQDIDSRLDQKQITSRIRETFTLEDIVTREFADKDQNALLDKLRKYKLLKNVLLLNGSYCHNAGDVIREAGRKCDTIIKELVEQKLGEYYFIESVDLHAPISEGFVILLRSMQTLPSDIMARVVKGFDISEFDPAASGVEMLNLVHEPLCMITGVLRSPDIEHLAQQFANLFVRIGLEDQGQVTVNRHLATAKSL